MLSFIPLLGSIGSGDAGKPGVSWLLYGMGRDRVIYPAITTKGFRETTVMIGF